jgi:hypothetical protein
VEKGETVRQKEGERRSRRERRVQKTKEIENKLGSSGKAEERDGKRGG